MDVYYPAIVNTYSLLTTIILLKIKPGSRYLFSPKATYGICFGIPANQNPIAIINTKKLPYPI